MRRHLWIAILALAVALFALLQFSCTNNPDNNPATTNTAAPEATPDTAVIEKELLRIENDWPRVMKERDGQAVRRVDADDVYLLSWDGSVATKEEDAKAIESGNMSADSIEINDVKVKVLDKDAAVVTGTITIKGGKYKAADKTADVSGQYRWIDTFARRDGEWKLVASASVKVLAPVTPAASPAPKGSPSPTASPATKLPAPVTTKPSPPVKASPTTRPTPLTKPSPVMKTVPPAVKPAATPQVKG